MKVLLSGATGLIGQAVGRELVKRGHLVIALSRNADRAKSSLSFQCEVRTWKNFDKAPELRADDKIDAAIHLAGEPVADKRWSAEQKKKIRDSRVIGTRTLAKALDDQRLKVWVQGSATGYYGDTGDLLVNENQSAGSDFLAEVVKGWEAEAQAASVKSGHRLVCIRTGIVFSNESGAFPKLLKIFRRGVGGRLGNGEQYMSWIHINDIANLFVFAVENEKIDGVINGTAPDPVTNQELTTKIAKAVGRREFLPVPKLALKIAVGEMSQALLASTRASSRAQSLGFKFQFEKFDSALADLKSAWQLQNQ